MYYSFINENAQISSEEVFLYLKQDSICSFISSAAEHFLHPNSVKISFGELNSFNGDITAIFEPQSQKYESQKIRIPMGSLMNDEYIIYNEFQVSPFGLQSNWKTKIVNYSSTKTDWEINQICRPLSRTFELNDSMMVWLGTSGEKPYSIRTDSLMLLNLESFEIIKIIPSSEYLNLVGLSNLKLRSIESLTVQSNGDLIANLNLNELSQPSHDFSNTIKSIATTDLGIEQIKRLRVYHGVDSRIEFLPVDTEKQELLFAFKEELPIEGMPELSTRRIYLVNHRLDTINSFYYQFNTTGLQQENIIYPYYDLVLTNGFFLVNQTHLASSYSGGGSRLHLFDVSTSKKIYSISTESNSTNKKISHTKIDSWGNVYFKGVDERIDNFYFVGKITSTGLHPWFSRINESSSQVNASIEVYPNPSQGYIWLSIPESSLDLERVLLYNTQGSVQQEFSLENGLKLELDPSIPNGVFYLRVLGQDGEIATSYLFILNR